MRIVVPLAAVLTACYSEPPPARHPVKLPEIVPGIEMSPEVTTEQHDEAVTKRNCHTEHWTFNNTNQSATKCEDVDGGSKTVTTHHVEVDYGGTSLTRGQIYAMTDADHERTWKRYDDLRASCTGHQLPRTIAGTMMTGAAIFLPLGSSIVPDDQTRFYVGAGVMAAAAVVYAIGYFTGGSVCDEANEFGVAHGIIDSQDAKFDVGEESERIGKLVKQFNTAHVANE